MIEATIRELRRHGGVRAPSAPPATVRTVRAVQQARLAAAQMKRSQGHGLALP